MKHFLLTFAFLGLYAYSFAQADGQFIYHKVGPKETLYSLVKKYNTNFATVETLNPSLADGNSGIQVGQTIKFPKSNSIVANTVAKVNTPASNTTTAPAKKETKPSTTVAQSSGGSTSSVSHVVKPKETVFSISKLYNVDISNLVEANNITSNSIKVGEKLIVDGATIAKMATSTNRGEELRLKPAGKNVKETGIAEVIITPNKSTKYLALHRSAPVGSNIKITNEATGHTIVARVIGNLNEKGPDENIMIKLSPYAYYQLRPRDARLRATVEYYLPAAEDEVVSK
jgi:LysM repeat protein